MLDAASHILFLAVIFCNGHTTSQLLFHCFEIMIIYNEGNENLATDNVFSETKRWPVPVNETKLDQEM